jgi:hypothetical protein
MRFDAAGNNLRCSVNTTHDNFSSSAIFPSVADVTYGQRSDDGGEWLSGDIDGAFFYNRYLSDAEITAMVNGGSGRQPEADGTFPLTEEVFTIGASGGDYASISAWQTAELKGLIANNASHRIKLIGSQSESITISSSWANDEDHPLIIEALETSRHEGVYTTASFKGRINHGGSIGLTIAAPYVEVQDLVFTSTGSTSILGGSANTVIVRRCISDGANNAYSAVSGSMRIENSIAQGGTNCVRYSNAGGSLEVYNCTLVCSTGNVFNADNGTGAIVEENNYCSTASGSVYAGTGVGNITKGANTATSNTEAVTVGLQSIALDTTTFTNVTDGTEDFHLPSVNSPLWNAGEDLSSEFSEDLVMIPRPQGDSFDIGALEFIETSASAINFLLMGV